MAAHLGTNAGAPAPADGTNNGPASDAATHHGAAALAAADYKAQPPTTNLAMQVPHAIPSGLRHEFDGRLDLLKHVRWQLQGRSEFK